MSAHPKKDVFANVISKQSAKPQTMADATALVGAIFDRLSADLGSPQSMLVNSIMAFTTASGDATGRNAFLVEVYHDTASDMATEVLLDSDTYTFVWAADGANSIAHAMQVALTGANRYVRVKITLTESGTVTTSAWVGGHSVTFGGMDSQPSSGFAAAGYEDTTEPSA
jgi:hypothetical protein